MKNQELEVKFHLQNLPTLEQRLIELGATLSHARVHEINLRFDRAEGELAQGYRVLRLRQDDAARLTYKGPSSYEQGARLRQEIEFEVSDFEAARALLEALGYEVAMMYEKYRTTYELGGAHVTLDEMPYGNFVEIEGPDPETIRRVNEHLGLDWSLRVPDSYTTIFDQLRQAMGLEFRDLSFKNFGGLEVSLNILGIQAADK
jgi:adenylate cyclase class 2